MIRGLIYGMIGHCLLKIFWMSHKCLHCLVWWCFCCLEAFPASQSTGLVFFSVDEKFYVTILKQLVGPSKEEKYVVWYNTVWTVSFRLVRKW